MNSSGPMLLEVKKLKVTIPMALGMVRAIDNVDLRLEEGESLGIVGESGCGKTMLCRSVMGLIPQDAIISDDSRIHFNGRILNRLSRKEMVKLRGREIAMIFQNPMTALNPVMTVGRQVAEPLVHHLGMKHKSAREKAVELMASVGIPNPARKSRRYPHQLSGGLRQRAVIAMALACEPKLLIADEPTTALDVTVQAEILNLLNRLQKEKRMAMVLVTHDLGVAAKTQNIAVMYGGKIVETAPTEKLFSHMRMPYTQALFESIPKIDHPPHTFLKAIKGQPPNLIQPPKGCRFAPRCFRAKHRCRIQEPPLSPVDTHIHQAACWFPL